jgi:16S rRNA (cytosine1402-N4)-methyltransferase
MYHLPVLLNACIEALRIRPEGVYVDVTFGGGGHSRAILEQLGPQGRLFAFDQDPDAKANVPQDPRFTLIEANFRYLQKYLRLYRITEVDGILADLGISSHQIDEPTRGFSTRFDGPLDMRMNTRAAVSAFEVVNTYSDEQLHKILGMYGEIRNARTAAQTIFAHRHNQPIRTTAELVGVLRKLAPRGQENRYFAQVFQALRIEVNEELKVLEEFLVQAPAVLAPQGRLAVISFHSLEDRLVKNFIKTGKFSGDAEKDLYGNTLHKPLESVSRKPIEAEPEELAQNPRSRSAKLRIAERI